MKELGLSEVEQETNSAGVKARVIVGLNCWCSIFQHRK